MSILAPALLLVPALPQDVQAPPGMVLVTEQEIVLGTPKEVLEAMVQDKPDLSDKIGAEFAGDRRPTLRVDPFFIQVAETTNEQYLAFVRATGHQPPIHWADALVDEAAGEYSSEIGAAKKAAKDAGEPIPQFEDFDRYVWWNENWTEVDWEMPEEIAAMPVIQVTYQDARAYAEWAGLRLMTEFEFQAAGGRGLSKEGQLFPWGDEWNDRNAIASENGVRQHPEPVGSAPGGKSKFGVYDLAGNVWEWTASPFEPLSDKKGSLGFDTRIGSKKSGQVVTVGAEYDSNKRVVVGGCFAGGMVTARLSTRRPTERYIATEATGFRCAADLIPGRTRAASVVDRLPGTARMEEDYALDRVFGRERWVGLPGTADVPGYSVIANYQHVLFLPLEALAQREVEGRGSKSLAYSSVEDGPVPFGLLDTSVTTIEPKLYPGTYVLAFRAAGEPRGQETAEKPEAESSRHSQEEDGIDPLAGLVDTSVDSIIAYDLEGNPVAAWETAAPSLIKNRNREQQGEFAVQAWVEPKKAAKDEVIVPADTLVLTPLVTSQKKHHEFKFEVRLRTEVGAVDDSWR